MKSTILAAAAALILAAPAVAQPRDVGNMAYPNTAGQPGSNVNGGTGGAGRNGMPAPGITGAQSGAYTRRPSRLTPTDVGNMAFPDPSLTPAGNLAPVPVGR